MKRILVAIAIAGLVGCGKDQNNNGGSATTATVPQNCLANGGYGCSWSSYPQNYQAYPTTSQGYYSGWNNGSYNYSGSNFGECEASYGRRSHPVYHRQNGLACFTIPSGFNYNSLYTYSYQGYSAYLACSANYACPSGYSCGAYGLCSY